MIAAIAVGNGASAQGQLGQLLRSSGGGTGLLTLETSSTGSKNFTFSGPSGTVITSHLGTVGLLTGNTAGTFSVNGVAGTPNITFTSLGGTAKTSITTGYDRLLLSNSDGLVDAVRISDVVGASGWLLAGNNTANAWDGTANGTGSFLGTKSAQPLVLATTNATAQAIKFYTGANGADQRMIIQGNGNVGIGVSSAATTFAIGSGSAANFSVDGANGNTTVAGTLNLSGAATLSSTLDVSGNLAVNTDKFTVDAASGNTAIKGGLAINTNKFTIAAATGNTAVAGTLDVTGAITGSAGAALTGTTDINISGAGVTNIGNASATTNISGAALNLVGVAAGSTADSVLLIGANRVKKIAVASLAGNVNASEQSLSSAYTLAVSDYLVSCTNSSAGSVTLPATPSVGKVYVIKSSGAGDVTVNRASSSTDTIDGQSSYLIPGGAGLSITFAYVATGKWVVID